MTIIGFCPEYLKPKGYRRCRLDVCPYNFSMNQCPHYDVCGEYIDYPGRENDE